MVSVIVAHSMCKEAAAHFARLPTLKTANINVPREEAVAALLRLQSGHSLS